jgi:hypothetical protein
LVLFRWLFGEVDEGGGVDYLGDGSLEGTGGEAGRGVGAGGRVVESEVPGVDVAGVADPREPGASAVEENGGQVAVGAAPGHRDVVEVGPAVLVGVEVVGQVALDDRLGLCRRCGHATSMA